MELKDTVELMMSVDYKERFKAEYLQTQIRYDKLLSMVRKYKEGTLDFKPVCSKMIFDAQIDAMGAYLLVLEERAAMEKIDLEDV